MERMTVAEAALLSDEDFLCLSMDEILIDRKVRIETSRLWAWLCSVEASTALANIAMNEALEDAELLVRLNMPATHFIEWFRRTDWDVFGLADELDGETEWAWCVLDRARQVARGMGNMASQVALRRPMAGH